VSESYARFVKKELGPMLEKLFPLYGPRRRWRIEYVSHSIRPSSGADFYGGILRIVVKTVQRGLGGGEHLEEELTVGRVPLTNEKGRFVIGGEQRPVATERAVEILTKGVTAFVRGLEAAGAKLEQPPAAWSREIPPELSTDLCRGILRELKETQIVPVLTPVQR
jgi:hypothetical protein